MTDPGQEMLVDAIVGIGFAGSADLAVRAQKAGLAEFTGNQHSEDWSWNRVALMALGQADLEALYRQLREAKQDHGFAVAQMPLPSVNQ